MHRLKDLDVKYQQKDKKKNNIHWLKELKLEPEIWRNISQH